MYQKVKRFLQRLSFWLPSKLPSGLTEFNTFAQSIINAYSLPDNDSFKWIIAVQVMHFDRAGDYKWQKQLFGNAYAAKRRVYLEIRGAEARQTAGEAFRIIKEKQQQEAAAKQAAQASTPAVSSAPALSVVPDEPKTT